MSTEEQSFPDLVPCGPSSRASWLFDNRDIDEIQDCLTVNLMINQVDIGHSDQPQYPPFSEKILIAQFSMPRGRKFSLYFPASHPTAKAPLQKATHILSPSTNV